MNETKNTDCAQDNEAIELLEKLEEISANTEDTVFLKELDSSEYIDYQSKFTPNNSESKKTKLGTLLVQFSLITEELLNEAIEEALELNIPLGRILVMSGWITQSQLNWTIQLQSLVRENKISTPIAIQISELITSSNMSFGKALEVTGCSQFLIESDTRLGDLLRDAAVIAEEELSSAIYKSQYLGLPLGRCLFLTGQLPEELLNTAINAQKFTRQGKISRDDAIQAIRKSAQRIDRLSPVPRHSYSNICKVKLGELLKLAGIVTEAQVEHAIEIGLVNNTPVGKVLIDLGLISETTLENALILQVIVAESNLTIKEAAFALIDIHYHGASVAKAISECTNKQKRIDKPNFKQFIATTGILEVREIESALENTLSSPYIISKALLYSGVLNDTTMQLALCVHFYVREELLSLEEALVLFNHANRNNVSIVEALEELGIEIKSAKTRISYEDCLTKYTRDKLSCN